jgi:hypothetical protein
VTQAVTSLWDPHVSEEIKRGAYLSKDFMLQEHGVPHDEPKDSNAGGCTCEILDRNETR